jgi:hypothetical protein
MSCSGNDSNNISASIELLADDRLYGLGNIQ